MSFQPKDMEQCLITVPALFRAADNTGPDDYLVQVKHNGAEILSGRVAIAPADVVRVEPVTVGGERDEPKEMAELIARLADNVAWMADRDPDPGTDALGALYLAQQIHPGEYRPDRTSQRAALRTMIAIATGGALEKIRRECPQAFDFGQGWQGALDCVIDDLPDVLSGLLTGEAP